MYVRGRNTPRHMKGKQVAFTLYLPPRKYWLLKAIADDAGLSMQHLVREALDEVFARRYGYPAEPRPGRARGASLAAERP